MEITASPPSTPDQRQEKGDEIGNKDNEATYPKGRLMVLSTVHHRAQSVRQTVTREELQSKVRIRSRSSGSLGRSLGLEGSK